MVSKEAFKTIWRGPTLLIAAMVAALVVASAPASAAVLASTRIDPTERGLRASRRRRPCPKSR